MRYRVLFFLLLFFNILLTSSCKNDINKSFMFWCKRPEIQTSIYLFSTLSSNDHQKITERLKDIDGYLSSEFDFKEKTITISYNSSHCRYMNFQKELENIGFINIKNSRKAIYEN